MEVEELGIKHSTGGGGTSQNKTWHSCILKNNDNFSFRHFIWQHFAKELREILYIDSKNLISKVVPVNGETWG